eukprot:s12_g17.t1
MDSTDEALDTQIYVLTPPDLYHVEEGMDDLSDIPQEELVESEMGETAVGTPPHVKTVDAEMGEASVGTPLHEPVHAEMGEASVGTPPHEPVDAEMGETAVGTPPHVKTVDAEMAEASVGTPPHEPVHAEMAETALGTPKDTKTVDAGMGLSETPVMAPAEPAIAPKNPDVSTPKCPDGIPDGKQPKKRARPKTAATEPKAKAKGKAKSRSAKKIPSTREDGEAKSDDNQKPPKKPRPEKDDVEKKLHSVPCFGGEFSAERCCGLPEEPLDRLSEVCGQYQPQLRYPDSHLTPALMKSVLSFVPEPYMWLEVGSYIGSSAITTAKVLKQMRLRTGVVCLDPFTGMVDMWADRKAFRMQFGLLERQHVADGPLLMDEFGHSRIYEMFLANVRSRGHQDGDTGCACDLVTLYEQGRIERPPEIIYLDSAHEAGETLLEVQEAWRLLAAPGVLFGDDWSWPGVQSDVLQFAARLMQRPLTNEERKSKELHRFDWPTKAAFQPVKGLAVVDEDDGAWMLFKEAATEFPGSQNPKMKGLHIRESIRADPKASEHRLFVTKIAPQITQQDVAAHFQQFGSTTDVYLPFIPGRPGHKGFAFVSFSGEEAVQAALANAPHYINGAEVVVDIATARQLTGDQPAGPSASRTVRKEGPDRIFVTRLPTTMTVAEVQKHFEQFGDVRDCYMPAIPGRGHKGFAFISFTDPASVKAATQELHQEINGTTVVVDVAMARSGMAAMQAGFAEVRLLAVCSYLEADWPGMAQPEVAPKIVPGRLFVTRIHPEITKVELEGYFGQYGELDDVYVPGKGAQRIAFVQFKVPGVAQHVTQQGSEHFVKPGASVTVDQAVARKSDGKAIGKGWHGMSSASGMGYQQSMGNMAQPGAYGGGYTPYGMMDPSYQVYQQQQAAAQGFMRFSPY